MVDIDKIEKVTRKSFGIAKKNVQEIRKMYNLLDESVISDRIPGYTAELLEFGDFEQDNFAVLFIDMRGSTKRAKKIGAEKTFLSMHVFIPAMLEVIKFYKGYVIDLMGDGIMVFFGGKRSELTKIQASQNAGLCGLDMLLVLDKVVNKILDEEKIWKIDCGVGVDCGKVVVTKIGINDVYDVKAYGDCINKASHFADDAKNEVLVSEDIREFWPSSKGGRISFNVHGNGVYKLNR